MRSIKYLLYLGIFLVLLACVIFYFLTLKNDQKEKVAIVLTLSHPALEDAKLGFINQLEKLFGDELGILEFNAEGNAQQANQIADQIHANSNIVAVFAIGTLAAQTIAKKEHEKPIIVAAVSDVSSLAPKRSKNLCGKSDLINPMWQAEALKKIIRPAINKVALLFSPSEHNSAFMKTGLEKAFVKKNISTVSIGVLGPQEIKTATLRACSLADAVLIPLDNQLVASMPAFTRAAKTIKCKIIASNESPIYQGALMAFGVDYKKSGEESADILYKLIYKNKKPIQIGFSDMKEVKIFQNIAQAKYLQVNFNNDSSYQIVKITKD